MALKTNITTLGPLVLPLTEQALFGVNMLMRKIYGTKKVKQYVPNFSKAFEHICIHTGARADRVAGRGGIPRVHGALALRGMQPRVRGPGAATWRAPLLLIARAHPCPIPPCLPPSGGRAVIDEIEKQLALGRSAAEPSRASLFRYGNVSSSSIW
jgi:hypothetical protein